MNRKRAAIVNGEYREWREDCGPARARPQVNGSGPQPRGIRRTPIAAYEPWQTWTSDGLRDVMLGAAKLDVVRLVRTDLITGEKTTIAVEVPRHISALKEALS